MLKGYYSKRIQLRKAWDSKRFRVVFALTSKVSRPEILAFLRDNDLPVSDVFAIGYCQIIGIIPSDDLVRSALSFEGPLEPMVLDQDIESLAARLAKYDLGTGFHSNENRWSFWRPGTKNDWAKVRSLANSNGYQLSYIFAYGLVASLRQFNRLDLIGGVL